jgi:acyl-CoA synthetase (AMP-forming)/AMP-acid ligase II/phosphosulfolactate synthase (CoM biosynthesis protein A)
MTPVQELLESRRGSTEPALFLGDDGTSASWAEIAAISRQWRRSGLAGPVGLALSNPLEMASHVVAALAAGVLVAPMDPSAPARDTAARAREMNLSAFVTDGAGNPRGLDALRQVHLGNPPTLPDVPARPALIMASSGSTGKAKIVPLTLEQLMATAQEVVDHLGLTPKERGYSPLPLFHIYCIVIGVLSALVADSTVVLDRRFSRRAFWDRVQRHDVTWLNLVPAILAILASDPDSRPAPNARGIRLARSASAPLPVSVLERFESRFRIPIVETYGMTEAASQITANPVDSIKPGSVGRPLGVELRVVDQAGHVVAADTVGRVQIRGSRVVRAYWGAGAPGQMEGRPADRVDGWLTTGDVGRLDSDGYLYLVGREGDVINRGGEKVRPREVEDVLLADNRVRSAVVVGREHPVVGEEPMAFVVPAPELDAAGNSTLAEDLVKRCRLALSGYKRPAGIEVVDSLPAGPTGKIRREEVGRIANGRSPSQPEARPKSIFLQLPGRESKPRSRGLTVVIDNGVAHGAFADAIATAAPYIDAVKFGWGTALVTPDIERKFAVLQEHDIGYFFGGTLFEKFVIQDRFESFLTLCRLCDCRFVEISNGTVDIPSAWKARYIARCAEEFLVLSEVGFKDPARSDELSPADWARAVSADLDAGAARVITEARENGKSGICRSDGSPRSEVLEAILDAGVDAGNLIFEAPNKQLQTYFIGLIGTDVNLGNVAPADVIGLETLRLGLRSDTLFHFEKVQSIACRL